MTHGIPAVPGDQCDLGVLHLAIGRMVAAHLPYRLHDMRDAAEMALRQKAAGGVGRKRIIT